MGAQHRAVQRLQFFLSESRLDADRVNDRRLELLLDAASTAPHGDGMLVIDDSGDRKDGAATAHVGRQRLGRYGKTDNGIVTVTMLRADERIYYPLHAQPYRPARHFPKGKNDPPFAPSCRSRRVWPEGSTMRGSVFGRWPPTVPTATRTTSEANYVGPGCRS
uniref:transposase n=1 Tax=Actinomadura physcomitrii TaxID=2650748 RepID=UPI0038B3DFDA